MMARSIALLLLSLHGACGLTVRDYAEAPEMSLGQVQETAQKAVAAAYDKNQALNFTQVHQVTKRQHMDLGEPIQFIDKHYSVLDKETTLRKWMKNGECFNLALTPQYNNQHSIFGIVDAFRAADALTRLTGVSACSGGTLPGSYIAAGKEYANFKQHFPKKGWGGFGPREPKITEDYQHFLAKGLPKTFEELKRPLAISLTKWDDLSNLKLFEKKHAHPMIAHTGDLYPAMLAGVATGNNNLFSDPGCPKCYVGFHPKEVEGQYPVTDGAFGDIWGTAGLPKLPKCSRLIHVLPLDYEGQVDPLTPEEIPTHPAELLSLVIVQPPVASHSYMLDSMHAKFITKHTTEEWNNKMFGATYTGTTKFMDQPIKFKRLADGSAHAVVAVGNELKKSETFMEKMFDWQSSRLRDNFWKQYAARGK